MKHLDLFSGIGGFALAADRVWENVEHTFVEYDEFCVQILKKHWPNAEIHGDIRAFVADAKRGRHVHGEPEIEPAEPGQQAQRKPLTGIPTSPVFLLTGGFPCQPFSHAGRRKGTEDDRYLWPPMLECISLFKPEWVIAENVAGLTTWNDGLVLETVCTDMEKEGYEVRPFVIPAVGVGAPHRRDRIWFVAYCIGDNSERRGETRNMAEAAGGSKGKSQKWQRDGDATNDSGPDVTDTQKQRSKLARDTRERGTGFENNAAWNANWLEVATRLCRVDDGVPRRLDRNPRLKALGNAIVPQVAEEIMKAIKEASLF